jgi:hypothetical protein
METLQTLIVPDHSDGCKPKLRSLYLNWIRMCIFLRCGGDNQFQEVPMESESLQPPLFIASKQTRAICLENAQILHWIENAPAKQSGYLAATEQSGVT